jgi:phosphohistidine swiveling domain-containing protein
MNKINKTKKPMRIKGFHIFRTRYKRHFPLFPSVLCIDYCSSILADKEYGIRLKCIMQAYDEEKLYMTIGYKEHFEKFGWYFVKRFLKDPKYLPKLVKWNEKEKDSLKIYLEKNFPINELKKISNAEFWRRFDGYIKKYRHFHLKNTPAWWLGSDFVEIELRKCLKRFKNADEIFEIITEPLEYKTENLLEELSLIDIAILAEKKGLKKLPEKVENQQIKKILAKHIDNFSYIPFGYNTGIVWGEKYFIDKVNKFLKNDPQKIKKETLRNIKDKKARRERKSKEFKLTKKEIILARALRDVAYLQELKKATQTKSHPMLSLVIFKELSRRLKIPANFFSYFSPGDFKEGLKNGLSREFIKEIRERKKVSAVVIEDLEYKWIYGEEVKKILRANNFVQVDNNAREIKGITASRGVARGRVSLCIFSTQINKVKEGNILVTSMTTPDFVPAMKKAAAIITDEGGITSHAAIVSRELKKPCIIGTKFATKVLKDGQLVKVDANKGIIRIIK